MLTLLAFKKIVAKMYALYLIAFRSFIRFVMIVFMCNSSFGGLVFVRIGRYFIPF